MHRSTALPVAPAAAVRQHPVGCGKTTHLAALMENRGRIVAMDRDANKIDRLRKDARRLGVSIAETVAADLAKPLSSEWREKFDREFNSGLSHAETCRKIRHARRVVAPSVTRGTSWRCCKR